MKVAELAGAQLDYYVGMTEGYAGLEDVPWSYANLPDTYVWYIGEKAWVVASGFKGRYMPSSDWQQGGPLLVKHLIGASPVFAYSQISGDHPTGQWQAFIHTKTGILSHTGDSALEAAMRCLVASVYGDEVA